MIIKKLQGQKAFEEVALEIETEATLLAATGRDYELMSVVVEHGDKQFPITEIKMELKSQLGIKGITSKFSPERA